MGIEGIFHANICVSDMERSLKFYRDILGFQVLHDFVIENEALNRALGVEKARVREGPDTPGGRRKGHAPGPGPVAFARPGRPPLPPAQQPGDLPHRPKGQGYRGRLPGYPGPRGGVHDPTPIGQDRGGPRGNEVLLFL